jgi:hypothetical protein
LILLALSALGFLYNTYTPFISLTITNKTIQDNALKGCHSRRVFLVSPTLLEQLLLICFHSSSVTNNVLISNGLSTDSIHRTHFIYTSISLCYSLFISDSQIDSLI